MEIEQELIESDVLDILFMDESAFEIDVPMFYYHVSEKTLNEAILTKGLEQRDPSFDRNTTGVYLWDNIESANHWLEIHETPDSPMEIWEVSSERLEVELIEYDEYGSGITCGAYVYRDNIPANSLRLLS